MFGVQVTTLEQEKTSGINSNSRISLLAIMLSNW